MLGILFEVDGKGNVKEVIGEEKDEWKERMNNKKHKRRTNEINCKLS